MTVDELVETAKTLPAKDIALYTAEGILLNQTFQSGNTKYLTADLCIKIRTLNTLLEEDKTTPQSRPIDEVEKCIDGILNNLPSKYIGLPELKLRVSEKIPGVTENQISSILAIMSFDRRLLFGSGKNIPYIIPLDKTRHDKSFDEVVNRLYYSEVQSNIIKSLQNAGEKGLNYSTLINMSWITRNVLRSQVISIISLMRAKGQFTVTPDDKGSFTISLAKVADPN